MDEYEISVAQSAERDIQEIRRYISMQLNEPTIALNMVQTIRKSIAKLKTTALGHPLVRDERLAALGYRPLVIKNYIAFYIANEKDKTVFIGRILYGRRDWKSIL